MKKILLFLAVLSLVLAALSGQTKKSIEEGAILHCWCWSFKTIEEKLPEIAAAGFTAIQTSPVNTCLVGENGGLSIFSRDGTGKWYYHYQPTDWKIGNYQLGNRDEFKSMCKKAEELGIGVIVDVLPNHTTPVLDAVSPSLYAAAGGKDRLYHENNKYDIKSYSNRLQVTTYKMGGLPDVNTENPGFQAYFMAFMNDAIECGADGFRFDTAKHIGLPDDEKDSASKENDFWPVFTGRKAVNGVYLKNADGLFIYGEVLQGGASREKDYAEYIKVTASSYGQTLRSQVRSGVLGAKYLESWRNYAGGQNLVTWIESHDTYANQGESAKMTDFQLREGWAVIAARKEGTPLFFSRPQGPEATQFPGVSKIGDAGNDQFKNEEVVAVNHFRTEMAGLDEQLFNTDDTKTVMCIQRSTKGIVIINADLYEGRKIKVKTTLADGVYTDKAHGLIFKVKHGTLCGSIGAAQICVLY